MCWRAHSSISDLGVSKEAQHNSIPHTATAMGKSWEDKNKKEENEKEDKGKSVKKTTTSSRLNHLVTCKFWKEFRCKFGDNCKNLHHAEDDRWKRSETARDAQGKSTNWKKQGAKDDETKRSAAKAADWYKTKKGLELKEKPS